MVVVVGKIRWQRHRQSRLDRQEQRRATTDLIVALQPQTHVLCGHFSSGDVDQVLQQTPSKLSQATLQQPLRNTHLE